MESSQYAAMSGSFRSNGKEALTTYATTQFVRTTSSHSKGSICGSSNGANGSGGTAGSKVKLCGYLKKKRNKVGGWRKMWFVLQDKLLLSYASKEEYDTKLVSFKDVLNLVPGTMVRPLGGFRFTIETATQAMYTFHCDDRGAYREWITMLLESLTTTTQSAAFGACHTQKFVQHFGHYSVDSIPGALVAATAHTPAHKSAHCRIARGGGGGGGDDHMARTCDLQRCGFASSFDSITQAQRAAATGAPAAGGSGGCCVRLPIVQNTAKILERNGVNSSDLPKHQQQQPQQQQQQQHQQQLLLQQQQALLICNRKIANFSGGSFSSGSSSNNSSARDLQHFSGRYVQLSAPPTTKARNNKYAGLQYQPQTLLQRAICQSQTQASTSPSSSASSSSSSSSSAAAAATPTLPLTPATAPTATATATKSVHILNADDSDDDGYDDYNNNNNNCADVGEEVAGQHATADELLYQRMVPRQRQRQCAFPPTPRAPVQRGQCSRCNAESSSAINEARQLPAQQQQQRLKQPPPQQRPWQQHQQRLRCECSCVSVAKTKVLAAAREERITEADVSAARECKALNLMERIQRLSIRGTKECNCDDTSCGQDAEQHYQQVKSKVTRTSSCAEQLLQQQNGGATATTTTTPSEPIYAVVDLKHKYAQRKMRYAKAEGLMKRCNSYDSIIHAVGQETGAQRMLKSDLGQKSLSLTEDDIEGIYEDGDVFYCGRKEAEEAEIGQCQREREPETDYDEENIYEPINVPHTNGAEAKAFWRYFTRLKVNSLLRLTRRMRRRGPDYDTIKFPPAKPGTDQSHQSASASHFSTIKRKFGTHRKSMQVRMRKLCTRTYEPKPLFKRHQHVATNLNGVSNGSAPNCVTLNGSCSANIQKPKTKYRWKSVKIRAKNLPLPVTFSDETVAVRRPLFGSLPHMRRARLSLFNTPQEPPARQLQDRAQPKENGRTLKAKNKPPASESENEL